VSCAFDARNKELKLHYQDFDPEELEKGTCRIGSFNNPIVDEQLGFKMEVLDENGNMIGFTEDIKVKGINNEGINVAAAFEKRDFNFVDKANSGQLGQHQIILESSIPLQRGCRVKIKYPNDYNITENLTSVRGTGFFESLSGADELSALG